MRREGDHEADPNLEVSDLDRGPEVEGRGLTLAIEDGEDLVLYEDVEAFQDDLETGEW